MRALEVTASGVCTRRDRFGCQVFAVCPVCGCDYTHHHRQVEVFCRAEEDGPSYLLRPGTNVVLPTSHNPSSRRGAVRIHFWGECGHAWVLDIIQHKGMTWFAARPTTVRES